MTTLSQTDLTNCDREPIHIPGSIQSHGCLIATDVNASIILRHSSNLPALFGIEGEINGRPLPPALTATPVVRKPHDGDDLIQAIARVLQGQ